MSKKTDFEEDFEYDNWSDYKQTDGKRRDWKKQQIENARRAKSYEKDSFFSE